jgi:hypothetical protein
MGMTKWRLLRNCVIPVAAAAVLGIGLAGTASASPAGQAPVASHSASPLAGRTPASSETFTLPAKPGTYEVSAGTAHAEIVRAPQATPMTTVTCTLDLFTPFYNVVSGVPSVVAGTYVICNGETSQIWCEVTMYHNGVYESQSTNTVDFQQGDLLSIVVPYAPGSYQTIVLTTINFPSDYTPTQENLYQYSPFVTINE